MAVLKADRCVYCGMTARGVPGRPAVELELVKAQAMLEPRAVEKPGWTKWVVRSIAAAVGLFIAVFFVGPCMKG